MPVIGVRCGCQDLITETRDKMESQREAVGRPWPDERTQQQINVHRGYSSLSRD